MKKYFIFILLVFARQSAQSQGNPADIPALLLQLAQSKSDTSRISICIKLAGCYLVPGRALNRIDSAALYLNKAKELNAIFQVTAFRNRINLFSAIRNCILFSWETPKKNFLPIIDSCKKTGDKFNEAQTWMYLGNKIQQDPQTYPFKLACYQNGLVLAREIGESYMESILQVHIAQVYTLQEKFDQAERELLHQLQRRKSVQPVVVMHIYDKLAFLYLSKGQVNKALEYALKTQQMMGITGDSTSAELFYHRLSWLYRSLGREKERHNWGKKELEFALATNNIPGVYSNIAELGGMTREDGNPHEAMDLLHRKLAQKKLVGINDKRKVQQFLGGIYTYEKKYDLAEKCYLEMIRLGSLEHRIPIWDRAFNNFIVGRFYYDRGFYSKARPFFETSVKDYEAYSVLPYRRRIHLLLFKTDSALGNYTEAIRHLNEANRIGDSIFNKERNRQIEELQIAYHTEQKDKNIRLLEEKEKLARSQLNHTQSTRNWIIAAACMLLIIAALQFRLAHIRKKNNGIINIKNKQLQHLVTEKEWLVKEIHHRVKNNLQMVVSLLNAQTEFLTHPSAIDAIKESRERMQAIAIIHQKLYQLDNNTRVNMRSYINELIDNIKHSFADGERIYLKADVADVSLDVSQSVPLGLILNEAITNAIKYAYPENEKGVIQISLRDHDADTLQLKIADHGNGLPADVDVENSNSLGIQLIKLFSEQLDGDLYFINNNGLTITLNFKAATYQDAFINKITA